MSVFFCPRCARSGVQADGYTYCTRCRAERQKEARLVQAATFRCPQCTHEREKRPDYRLCTVCGADREARRGEGKGLKSREELGWMKGFSQLSQDYLMRRL